MSLLSVVPENVSAASGHLEKLGSALRSANAAAAAQTTAVVAPAADEVSAAITALFGTHAQEFQAVNAQAAAFHDEFVGGLSGGAAQYVSTELANAQQTLVSAVNAPAQALLGHPLIGTGGTPGAAAVLTADEIGNTAQVYNWGPFRALLNVTGASLDENTATLAVTESVALSLNSPYGSAALGGGYLVMAVSGADGSFTGSFGQTWPLGNFATVSATGALFGPGPVISALTANFDGLTFAWPGTSWFGPVVPSVSYSPTP
jgi:hypothetical protein